MDMPKKEKSVHCPNCGAPIKSIPVYGVTAKCSYCDALVNVGEFFQPKLAAPPDPPKRKEYRPAPSAVKQTVPSRKFSQEDYIGYKKPRRMSEQDILAIIEIVLGIAIFFMIPVWLRGCLM